MYWPALNELAAQRRSEQEERWVRGGKRVGEYEGYLQGGEVRSLSEEEEEAEEGKGKGKGREVDGDNDGKADKVKEVNGAV